MRLAIKGLHYLVRNLAPAVGVPHMQDFWLGRVTRLARDVVAPDLGSLKAPRLECSGFQVKCWDRGFWGAWDSLWVSDGHCRTRHVRQCGEWGGRRWDWVFRKSRSYCVLGFFGV